MYRLLSMRKILTLYSLSMWIIEYRLHVCFLNISPVFEYKLFLMSLPFLTSRCLLAGGFHTLLYVVPMQHCQIWSCIIYFVRECYSFIGKIVHNIVENFYIRRVFAKNIIFWWLEKNWIFNCKVRMFNAFGLVITILDGL